MFSCRLNVLRISESLKVWTTVTLNKCFRIFDFYHSDYFPFSISLYISFLSNHWPHQAQEPFFWHRVINLSQSQWALTLTVRWLQRIRSIWWEPALTGVTQLSITHSANHVVKLTEKDTSCCLGDSDWTIVVLTDTWCSREWGSDVFVCFLIIIYSHNNEWFPFYIYRLGY